MVKLKVALIQMSVEEDAGINLQKALLRIEQCSTLGAKLVILPEMFLCPYQAERFAIYAEKEGGPTWRASPRQPRPTRFTLWAVLSRNWTRLENSIIPVLFLIRWVAQLENIANCICLISKSC